MENCNTSIQHNMLHPKCRKTINGTKVMSMAERKRKMDSTKVVAVWGRDGRGGCGGGRRQWC